EDLIADLKANYTIVIVTHNMQQAARVSDRTAFFNISATGEPGRLIEMNDTTTMFTNPAEQATEDYVSGRVGHTHSGSRGPSPGHRDVRTTSTHTANTQATMNHTAATVHPTRSYHSVGAASTRIPCRKRAAPGPHQATATAVAAPTRIGVTSPI